MPSVMDSPTTFVASDTTKDSLAALLYGQGSIAVCLERLGFAFSAASETIKTWGGAKNFDGSIQDDFHLHSTIFCHYSTSFLQASSHIKKAFDPISSLVEDEKHLNDLKELHRTATQNANLAKTKLSKKMTSKRKKNTQTEVQVWERAVQEVAQYKEKVMAEEAIVSVSKERKAKIWMDAILTGLNESSRKGLIISDGGKRISNLAPATKQDDSRSRNHPAISILAEIETRLRVPTPDISTSTIPTAVPLSSRPFLPGYGGLPIIQEVAASYSGLTTMRTTKYTHQPGLSSTQTILPLGQSEDDTMTIPSKSPSTSTNSSLSTFFTVSRPSTNATSSSRTPIPLLPQEKGTQLPTSHALKFSSIEEPLTDRFHAPPRLPL
ncbi:hypothetical protein JAAARDRAFT_697876 [Jaapia argillacea MUCL 33604]|uniref:Uncharacterized protein n=1 Tax=Jaapia argillacea MUCL 33604 TaxID=933084 RepID=A0A067PU51_9AGAM|nr:hypothetical protein JAAARDRAFT_697876 [Jaapia argillacea MUCL 33604]